MNGPRYVLVRVDDERVTRLRVYHDDGTGPLEPDGYFVPVPPDDTLVHDMDLAYEALLEAAVERRMEDERFDISRADAAENERMADAYAAAARRLHAAFGIGGDTHDD